MRVCIACFVAFLVCCGKPKDDDADLNVDRNGEVQSVSALGTQLTAESFCASGDFELKFVAKNGEGKSIVSNKFTGTCEASLERADTVIPCEISSVSCRSDKDEARKRTVSLVIIDNSGSMRYTDPDDLRPNACAEFVNNAAADDVIAVGDYGSTVFSGLSGTTVDAQGQALRLLSTFSSDKTVLGAACKRGKAQGGTPLYTAAIEGLQLLQQAQSQYSESAVQLIILSDGSPTDQGKEMVAALSKQLNIPIYIVGLAAPANKEWELAALKCAAVADCAILDLPEEAMACEPLKGGDNVCQYNPAIGVSGPIAQPVEGTSGAARKLAFDAAGGAMALECSEDSDCDSLTMPGFYQGVCAVGSDSKKLCKHRNVTEDPSPILQELTNAAGGAYIAVGDAAKLGSKFKELSSSIGSGECVATAKLNLEGIAVSALSTINGAARIGSNSAQTEFQLTVPRYETGSYCRE